MSEASTKAAAFVTAHLDEATAIGEELAERIDEPEVFLAALVDDLTA